MYLVMLNIESCSAHPVFNAQKCELAESVALKLPIESISAVWLVQPQRQVKD
jgi:hypothetical protein